MAFTMVADKARSRRVSEDVMPDWSTGFNGVISWQVSCQSCQGGVHIVSLAFRKFMDDGNIEVENFILLLCVAGI